MPSSDLPVPDDGYVPDMVLYSDVPGSPAMHGGRFVFWCESVRFQSTDGTPLGITEDLVMAPAPAHLQPSWVKQTGLPALAVFEVREIVSEYEARAVMVFPLFSHC